MTRFNTLQINIHEAKAKLSHYVTLAEKGHVVTLARRNVPVVSIQTIEKKKKRTPGGLKGPLIIHGNILDPLPEDVIDSFYNSKIFP